jgi:hypothetical protein
MADGKSQARADRLKAALRENLKRRKVQARSREALERPVPGDGACGSGADNKTED